MTCRESRLRRSRLPATSPARCRFRRSLANAAALDELRLCYVRLGFLASAYVNQVGQPQATLLPKNIAVPLCSVCRQLGRPPILSYDGYALYNWKRFDPAQPIVLGNIDTIQNFVHLYDEHWFILVHVEIEAIAAEILAAIDAPDGNPTSAVNDSPLRTIAARPLAAGRGAADAHPRSTWTRPSTCPKTFRPHIRFFENVVYEGVTGKPLDYRGETGCAQSEHHADDDRPDEDPAQAVGPDRSPRRHAPVHAGRASGPDRRGPSDALRP